MVKKKMIEDFFELISDSFTFYKNGVLYDKVLKTFYKELKGIKNKKIKLKKTEFNSDSLSESHFVSKKAKNALKKIKYGYTTKLSVLNAEVELCFLTSKNTSHKEQVENAKRVYKLVMFLMGFSNMNLETIKITLFLHDDNKKIKKKYEILSPKHVNTAVTYACAKNGEIFLYRKEEWFKVLAHELMHSLCLDFSGLGTKSLKDNCKKLFKIKSDYEISESYAEYWATIINILFLSFDISNSYKPFKENVTMMLDFEKIFSLYQCTKILKYMGISNYSTLLQSQSQLYEEKTNVFAYYFIKTVLLYDYEEFMQFCYSNNPPANPISFYKSPGNLNTFFNYILKHYNSDDLRGDFDTMEKIFDNVNGNDLKYTMRMTLFEKN